MLKRIQARPKWQRLTLFYLAIVAVILFFVILTVLFINNSIVQTERLTALPILPEEISVSEFAELPDEDAYPAALAIGPDGTLYTGSYVSGVLYTIAPDGSVAVIDSTRGPIGSVSGLDIGPDGALYILDRIHPLQVQGAVLWRYSEADGLQELRRFSSDEAEGMVLPDDIALDAAGNIYISDRGPDRVWRLSPDGSEASIWWQSPIEEDSSAAPTGLAYDAASERLIVTDSARDAIYAVPVASSNPSADTVQLFRNTRNIDRPGLDGVAVLPDGEIMVAALGVNRVGRIESESELQYLAGNFRGSSDLAYDSTRERLYVSNWDQRALLPLTIVFIQVDLEPHLPFAIDLIEFEPSPPAETGS